MVIAHLGIAVALAGMASESAFTKETLVAARPGQTVAGRPVQRPLRRRRAGRRAELDRDRGAARRAARRRAPRSRSARRRACSARRRPPTSEAAIATVWDGQLYVAIGEEDEQGRWQLRLWWKPFVTLIWLGGALVALGGLLALVGRLRRERRGQAEEAPA